MVRVGVALFFILAAMLSVQAGEWITDSEGNILTPPIPTRGREHYIFNPINEAKDPHCPRRDEVIKHYIQSESNLKSGNVKMLAGDLPQAFSDAWRQKLHIKSVPVSAVVAQPLDLASLGGGKVLDVTEFGANGCAFTRTVMPAAIWEELLKAAIGVDI
jgi:hypothetical protein